MRICVVSKYPPIEGGVSSTTYWLAKGLGELGHDVFIVSNCWEVEERYREVISEDELHKLEPKNVHLFSTDPNKRIRFIPYFNPYDVKLANLSIDVIRKYDPDVIFSFYLLPYGVSAFIAKQVTKKPLIVKHAGSDITRLFNSSFLRTMFIEIFKSADKIITNQKYAYLLSNLGIEQNKFTSLYKMHKSVNPEEFNSNIKPFDLSKYRELNDLPVFTYFGKLERWKKCFHLINAAAKIEDDFILLFISEGGEQSKIIEKLIKDNNLWDKTILLPFHPPWRMPSIINASTCVVSPENSEIDAPVPGHVPKKLIEAMSCGKCTIIGKGIYEKYNNWDNEIQDGINTFAVNSDNVNELADKMRYIIRNPDVASQIGKMAEKTIVKDDFEKYLKSFVDICNQVIV